MVQEMLGANPGVQWESWIYSREMETEQNWSEPTLAIMLVKFVCFVQAYLSMITSAHSTFCIIISPGKTWHELFSTNII